MALRTAGSTANRYRYSGEQYDEALGLYYLRARYFNTLGGRFWSMYSFEGGMGDPASLHKYTYANNLLTRILGVKLAGLHGFDERG